MYVDQKQQTFTAFLRVTLICAFHLRFKTIDMQKKVTPLCVLGTHILYDIDMTYSLHPVIIVVTLKSPLKTKENTCHSHFECTIIYSQYIYVSTPSPPLLIVFGAPTFFTLLNFGV
jgi:hypothetical protein